MYPAVTAFALLLVGFVIGVLTLNKAVAAPMPTAVPAVCTVNATRPCDDGRGIEKCLLVGDGDFAHGEWQTCIPR